MLEPVLKDYPDVQVMTVISERKNHAAIACRVHCSISVLKQKPFAGPVVTIFHQKTFTELHILQLYLCEMG